MKMQLTMWAVYKDGEIITDSIRPTQTKCMLDFLSFAQEIYPDYSQSWSMLSYPTNWIDLKKCNCEYHPIIVTIQH